MVSDPSAILFVHLLYRIRPKSFIHLECLVLEKLELKAQNDFSPCHENRFFIWLYLVKYSL